MIILDEQDLNEIKNGTICFSIIVTEYCNCSCSYCHFYLENINKNYVYCISNSTFNDYITLIKYFKNVLHQNIHVRFSGGEPLILGEKLFYFSKRIYEELNIMPYVLTNGKLLNEELLIKAKEAKIDKFIMSFENPFKTDKNSVDTYTNIATFNSLKKYDMILPGVVVLTTDMFDKLSEICDIFYTNIGLLPIISEVSFKAYTSPSNHEIKALYNNVRKVVEKYYLKTDLQLFPYITPEIAYNYKYKYVLDLYAKPRFGLNDDNIEMVASKIYMKILEIYINKFCNKKDCAWFESCQHIRNFWIDKMNDYCKLKQAISDGFLDACLKLHKL